MHLRAGPHRRNNLLVSVQRRLCRVFQAHGMPLSEMSNQHLHNLLGHWMICFRPVLNLLPICNFQESNTVTHLFDLSKTYLPVANPCPKERH